MNINLKQINVCRLNELNHLYLNQNLYKSNNNCHFNFTETTPIIKINNNNLTNHSKYNSNNINSMNNTSNFYYRTAEFFNHLPVFFDELQTYSGSINKLIMSLTEGIDRGKANVEGGTQKTRYWNNSFIFTGEESASEINSGGGTLNRLIEIYITKNVIKNGIKTCEIINKSLVGTKLSEIGIKLEYEINPIIIEKIN